MNRYRVRRRAAVLSLVVVAMCGAALMAPGAASVATALSAEAVQSDRGFAEDDGSTAAPLPMIKKVQPDGVVIEEADPQALRARITLAATSGCGRQCDAQNPATYVYYGPGGPSNWYPCSYDAITARAVIPSHKGWPVIELRYSPRCRTAWARSGAFVDLETYSFYLNGVERTSTWEWGNGDTDPKHTHFTAMVDDADLLAEASGGSRFDINYWWWTDRY